jgi:hypothetical protein
MSGDQHHKSYGTMKHHAYPAQTLRQSNPAALTIDLPVPSTSPWV